MNSQALAALLLQQSSESPHEIRLNDLTLGTTGLDALVERNLVRQDGTIILVVDPSTIPQNPPAAGFTLQANVPAGADGFLSLDGCNAQIQFLVGASSIDLVLTVSTSVAGKQNVPWVFSQSFPELENQPYDDLTLKGPQLVFSTGAAGTPSAGLSFDGTLTLDGLFQMLATLTHASTTYALTGDMVRGKDGFAFDLQAKLTDVGSLTLGSVLTISDVAAGVSLAPFVSEGNSSTVTSLYLGASVDFKNSNGDQFPLGIRAQMPLNNPNGQILIFSVIPFIGTPVAVAASPTGAVRSSGVSTITTTAAHGLTAGGYVTVAFIDDDTFNGTFPVATVVGPESFTYAQTNLPDAKSGGGTVASGIQTSLLQLGALVGGAAWDDFFDGPAAPLKSYFETFGLLGYNMTFMLSTASVSSISLSVGTLQPWKLWGDYTMTLAADWNILFIGGGATVQTLAVRADFNFKTINFEIEVDLPALLITGRESGEPLTYSLDDLNDQLFEGKLAIPPDLLTVSVADFNISISVPNKQFYIGATASASISLFGTPLLGIHNMAIGVNIDASGPKTLYTATLDGQISLGPIYFQTDATITNDPKADTVLSMHLVDETVGSMLNHLVHLVDPTYDISLPAPWSKLLDIKLDALVLKITLPGAESKTQRSVALSYDAEIDLGFIKITSISLVYLTQAAAGSNVTVALSGSFLGQEFGTGGDSANPPLAWDAMNGSPPSVPGQGSSLFDLQYVGFGQHIAFQGVELTTVEQVMKALRQSVLPSPSGQLPPFGQNGLAFSQQSNWLIGAQFSIMGTLAISAIFNDPNLYGILITLSGEKAKIFAGLSFEILYRKVTDTIGVYHIELKLPDAMRNLQFGEVSITLPVIIIDIYTNGNFRVNLGFPVGLDFSNSFCIQVFPFIGYGGFYFALLDGATSTRVPQITNGTFSPVIEFGVALSIGVGKTIDEGILSGGISVTVVGILQGCLAWFHPTDGSSKEMYYWFQGSISIVGRLYATINFAIIQASLDVTAYATVTLTIESHKPIYIAISAGVSVRVSVKIIFFTIHLSFRATINASFTIGSASPTPWQLAPAGGGATNAPAPQALPQLRGQQTLYAASPLHSHANYRRALRRAILEAAPPEYITNWPAVCVLPQGKQTVTIWATPAFTKSEAWTIASGGAVRSANNVTITTTAPHDLDAGDTATIAGVSDSSLDGTFTVASVPTPTQFTYAQQGQDSASGNGTATAGRATGGADAIILLAAENSIDPEAATLNEHRALFGASPESAPFNLLMQALLGWGVYVETNSSVTDSSATVTADQLADLHWQLQQDETVAAAFDYATLTNFLAANFTFDVQAEPQGVTGVALFPMFPAVTVSDTAGTSVNFGGFDSVDPTYQEKVQAYFRLLQVQYESRDTGGNGNGDDADADGLTAAQSESMATVLFSQYFNMLMSAGAKAAVDLLAAYPYTPQTAMSIADIGTAVGDPTLVREPSRVVSPNQELNALNPGALFSLPGVVHQLKAGETFATVAADFNAQGALNSSDSPYTLADLLAANNSTAGIYNVGTSIAFSGLTYTTQPNDTLNLVGSRLLLRAAGPPQLSSINNLASTAQALQQLNPSVADVNQTLAVSVAPASAGGAVRAGNTVTITTTAPHGLVTGASVTVSGVDDSSFDGTFTVASVLGPLQFTYAQNGSDSASGDGTAAGLAVITVAATIAPADGGAARASGVITFTTTAPHNFAQGNLVSVYGVADNTFDGQFTIISVPTPQSFTVQQSGQPDAKSGGGFAGIPAITTAQGSTYSVVAGDTLTLIAGYFLAVQQSVGDIPTYVAALLQLNTGLPVSDPTQTQPAGTKLALPPVTRAVAVGDTIYSMATTLDTTVAAVQTTLTALPTTTVLLAPQGVVNVPLRYAVAAGDTFSGIAAKFNLTLDDVTNQALAVEGLFAPQTWQIVAGNGAVRASGTTTLTTTAAHGLASGNSILVAGVADDTFDGTYTVASVPTTTSLTVFQASQPDATSGGGSVSRPVTVNDLPSINVGQMMTDLTHQAEWNNASAMVSRFLLSGLRLPDPNDPYFQSLSVEDLLDPTKLAAVRTKPLFKLTGQQYSLPSTLGNYQITLTNSAGVGWLQLGSNGSLAFGLTSDQQNLMELIASTPLAPGIQTLARLALFQMVPARIALQNHIAWQAAVAPSGCLSSSAATGNPSVWLFPDSLVQQLDAAAAAQAQQQTAAPLLYELVVAKHHAADQPVVAAQADCYAWATIVDFTVSLPVADGDAPSLSNVYVIGGADDTGAALLQQLYNYLADPANNASATLYLLYSPNPTSANPSGLSSDELHASATYILKTNLSTLTHSGGNTLFESSEEVSDETVAAPKAVPDPTSVYAAPVSDAADFIALLWEASVTRSGGFYLNYVNQNGGAALPATVFGSSSTATLSLVVVLDSQAATRDAAILPTNNCVVVGDNLDTSTSSVFVQPATYTVQPYDCLLSALTDFNKDWATSYTLAQLAAWNQTVPLLLQVGAPLATPSGGKPYLVQYGDTLAGLVTNKVFPDLNTLLTTGNNAASAILAPGAQLTIPGYGQNPYTVEYGDTLAGLVAEFGVSSLDALLSAGTNSTSPILVTGAPLALPASANLYTIAAGDTLAGIVQNLKLSSLDALMSAGSNATSAVLAAGAQMQFAEGVLSPSTIVPPGTVGFEMTRTNPDPDNLPLDELPPAQVLSSLFNLVGFSIAQEGAFTASGEGLPTSPADSEQAQADGLAPRDLGDSNDPNWFYQQTLSVAPFGSPQQGSASAALPAARSNPYNGVGNDVTMELNLQDTYGNAQPLPAPFDSIEIPVGYFDQIASLGSWPSLAVSYEVDGPPPVLDLQMTMQQARYVPSPSVDVNSALAAVAADLASYTNIYYQLAQPDFAFTLRTTLDADSMNVENTGYQLSKTPFFAFAYGAYVYLAALNTMRAVQLEVSGGTTSVLGVTTLYGVTAQQLFAANQNQLFNSLFGSTALVVPQMYATVSGDSLSSIVKKWPAYNPTVTGLAALNESVALNPGTDFQATQRTASAAPTVAPIAPASSGAVRKDGSTTVTTTAAHGLVANDYVIVAGVSDSSFDGEFMVVSAPDPKTITYAQPSAADASSGGGTTSTLTPSLGQIAQGAHASAAAVAGANAQRTDILRQGAVLTVGTKSYTLGASDYLANAAEQLGSTVAEVATANQWLQGVFLPNASLTVTDVLAGQGDTLLTLANNFAGGDLDTFVTNNADVPDLFESGTPVQIGVNQNPTPPAADDTLTTFAATNKVTVDELAAANVTNAALFASGAKLAIPGVLTNPSSQQFSTYTAAQSGETLAAIAQKFGKQPADILALNSDISGLLAAGQPIKDTSTGKSVTTAAGDTFDSVIARFQQQFGVTVSPAQLASDVAGQTALVVPSSLWLCPPMLGNANGLNKDLSLAGLAAQYNTDVATLAGANAAAIGFLASGQTLPGWNITTNEYETLNSVVNRLTEQGVTLEGAPADVTSVATALATLANLVNPQASVVPVPSPSPAGNSVTLKPKFTSPVFQILVQIISTRDAKLVDPDFAGVSSVSTSTYGVAPEPDQNDDSTSAFTLTQFASDLQTAMPGLQVATGDPIAEGDPASASTIWAVNFGSSYGTPVTFAFEGTQTQYFALPPLSTSLMGGSVQIIPYVSGQNPPFTGQAQPQTFQAVDLDTWLNTFLQAVDTFLSPAYAVPAYAIDPADGVATTKAVVTVVEQKQILANALSQRLQYVLQDQQNAGGGSSADAVAAIYQAMLTQLSSAFTVDTLVQVPVTVSNPGVSDPLAAPRLSGKVNFNDAGGAADPNLPNDFSFSTAKVSLTDSNAPSTPNATFLFSVKAPASHKEASLNLQYVVTEMELPDPSSVIGSYEGSSWLKFILPLDDKATYIGDVDIPIPLRSYPSPVTLVSQTARQSADAPPNASSLLGWDFDFVYQHDDAEQDTPLVAVSFNATGAPQLPAAAGGVNLGKVFQALAQFMAVYPTLKPDLDLLTQLAPGVPTATPLAAVEAFAYCVKGVAQAFTSNAFADFFVPTPVTYFYQLQKNQSGAAEPTLTTLTITSVNPETMQPQQNPTVLWPAVVAQYNGSLQPLTPVSQSADSAVYNYPAGIPADAQFLQYFLFGVWAVAQSGGAARASGTTTITTESPHGLAAGDTVAVNGVTDTSFNGTFTLASVPGPQTFTYAQAGAADSSSGGGTVSVLTATLTASIATDGGATRALGEATITTNAPHGFDAGDAVTVAGVTDSSFDGTFTIDTVPSPTEFTYAQASGLPDSSSGGGTAQWAAPPAASALSAPQLFSFKLNGNGLNVLAQQSGRAGVSITRNLSLVGEGVTNGAFVYQTPLTSFTTNATPSVFAANEIVVGAAPTAIAEALGQFLQTLFTSQNQWTQGQDTLTIRLAAGYSYALATSPSSASALPELNAVVPILLVPSQSFDPTSDWQWPGYNSAPNPNTFVTQVQSAIAYWQKLNSPSTESGSYIFDLTVYASGGQLQPLIHATNLQYKLAANESDGGD